MAPFAPVVLPPFFLDGFSSLVVLNSVTTFLLEAYLPLAAGTGGYSSCWAGAPLGCYWTPFLFGKVIS